MKNIDALFKPKRVAVIGATADPKKIGHQVLKNIVEGGFQGEIIPIHPHADRILGLKAYSSITQVPPGVDLVVIAIPAALVIKAMQECAESKVQSVAVITSGFAEVGNFKDEEKLKEIADDNAMALLGPNIFGLAYAPSHLNASFGPKDIYAGKIVFITQSGALGIGLMGWTVMKKIGLAALVSIGNKADIDEQDLITYFNKDQQAQVILLYMEGLKDGRKFLRTKIEKPTVVLKVGRSSRGAKAAASHTGSLSGSDKIYDGVFNQLGILRASTEPEPRATRRARTGWRPNARRWARLLQLKRLRWSGSIPPRFGLNTANSASKACPSSIRHRRRPAVSPAPSPSFISHPGPFTRRITGYRGAPSDIPGW